MTWTSKHRAAHKYNKEQRAAYQRAWRARNMDRVRGYAVRGHDRKLEQNKRYRTHRWETVLRPLLWAAKDKPCADCGGRFPPCVMDFDHRDPTTKIRSVGHWSRYFSVQGLLDEMEKCDLVCANCHRIRTFTRRGSPSALSVRQFEEK